MTSYVIVGGVGGRGSWGRGKKSQRGWSWRHIGCAACAVTVVVLVLLFGMASMTTQQRMVELQVEMQTVASGNNGSLTYTDVQSHANKTEANNTVTKSLDTKNNSVTTKAVENVTQKPTARGGRVDVGDVEISDFDIGAFMEESMLPDPNAGGKRVFHMVITRMGQGMGSYPIHMRMRLDLFEAFAFPSIRNQTGPFLWVILVDPTIGQADKQRLFDIVAPIRNRTMFVWSSECITDLKPLIRSRNPALPNLLRLAPSIYDVTITTRFDSDDVMHPNNFLETRQAAAKPPGPFTAVSYRGGYTWNPSQENDAPAGHLRGYNFSSLGVGLSLINDGPYGPLQANVFAGAHNRLGPTLNNLCTSLKIPSDKRNCSPNSRVYLPAPGWIYVRTAISDSLTVMGQGTSDGVNHALGPVIKGVEGDEILEKTFNLNVTMLRDMTRTLPGYTSLLAGEPLGPPKKGECGWKRAPLKKN
eukprot:comp20778_c0_seq1/m.27282 comp20778_c0_seq1/g.27282  ORF comp20778_c0_seq1/g.27282 comp20778_c0_seq1/m.27282 type:complete len:472 (-) comp20778_c0_seq1:213-1628(-)